MDDAPYLADAHPPREIARMVERLGVAKAQTDAVTLVVLAVLAGAFISLGALFFTVVVTGASLGFGVTRILGGLSFCLGLVLVVVAGAELFTGNNLLAMAWASRLISTRDVMRHWLPRLPWQRDRVPRHGAVRRVGRHRAVSATARVGETAIQIAHAKVGLSLGEAFARGVLCNALVCLAVWLAMGGRSVADKILAIVFPITAFVDDRPRALDRQLVLPALRPGAGRAGRGVGHGCRQEPRRGERGQHCRRNAAGRRRVLGCLLARRPRGTRQAVLIDLYPRGLNSSIALCISCFASSSCSRMSAMSIFGLPGNRSLLQ